MAQKDLHHSIKTHSILHSDFITNVTKTGIGFDTTGTESVEFVLSVAEITVLDFVITMTLQHSETDSNYLDVPAEFILGDPASIDQDNDAVHGGSGAASLGYIGPKRWVRAQVTGVDAGGSEGTFFMGVVVVADNLHHIPLQPTPAP